jgi:hypothetical protein
MADTLTITDNRTGKQYESHQGRRHPRHRPPQIKAGADDRADDLRPGVPEHRRVPQRHHLHRRRQGHPAYRGYPIEQLAEHCNYLEWRT